MACDLTKGRGLDCSEGIGGIRSVSFVALADVDITSALGVITDIGVTSIYRYTLPEEVADAPETINHDRQTGTVFYEQTVNAIFNKQTVEDRNEVLLLAKNRLVVIVELESGDFKCYGATRGMTLGGSIVSGVAYGDRNGYELEFTGKEAEPALFFDADPATYMDVTLVEA